MGAYIEVSAKHTSQRREGLQHKHPCLNRNSNAGPTAPQSASLTTISNGRLKSDIPKCISSSAAVKYFQDSFFKERNVALVALWSRYRIVAGLSRARAQYL
ncbi:hypothetical protein TNCV_3484791 [Trichonephila clavipes]|nr:hypothetical protein TNCV_3484791 [Trichonephila clavipes]